MKSLARGVVWWPGMDMEFESRGLVGHVKKTGSYHHRHLDILGSSQQIHGLGFTYILLVHSSEEHSLSWLMPIPSGWRSPQLFPLLLSRLFEC